LARKIKDLIKIFSERQDFEELVAEEGEDQKFDGMGTDIIELFRDSSIPIDELFHQLDQFEVDRVRAILSYILINSLGLDRNEVYGLLYAEGMRIVWH